jgi:fermentation-respiration switch protein FrsA (DUF1100 family)
MGLVFDDDEMEGQLSRTLIAVHSGSADLGEALATARRVEPGDYDRWFEQWSTTAQVTQERAASALSAGRRTSARQGFLRAAEYWRQAIFFIRHDPDDLRLQDGWHAHRNAFRSALPLLDHEVVVDEIPFDGARMGTYLFRSPLIGDRRRRPVVLAPCGYDSTAEAGYTATAYMALRHGYDCVVWEGPGQGGMLYDQRIPMRPDFETVLGTVVDWLLGHDDVDPAALAVIGRSFGGYLAPRGVSGEPRISALVCDPGQYDIVSRIVGTMFDQRTWERILTADPELDEQLETRLGDPHGLEYYGARMVTMGARTVGEFLRMQPAYTLQGRAELIGCPVLITEGEGDFAAQGRRLYEALSAPKELKVFSEREGAGGHCEGLGATLFEEAVFDWLDTTLELGTKGVQ